MRDYLALASRVASLSTCNHRHGCVIVRGRHILGLGFNKSKTHPRSRSRSIHAELAAILNARTDISGATVYVARVNRRGQPRLSAPCAHCRALLHEAGITDTNIVWTT